MICSQCFASFEPARMTQKYCSAECRQEASQHRIQQRRKPRQKQCKATKCKNLVPEHSLAVYCDSCLNSPDIILGRMNDIKKRFRDA